MIWRVEPYAVAFTRPLATAHGVWRRRRGFLVSVTDAEGRTGRGEAVPLPEWGTESYADCLRALRTAPSACRHLPREGGEGLRLAASAAGFAPSPLAGEVPARAEGANDRAPAASAALEQALLDLEAQQRGLPLSALLGVPLRTHVPVNALITDAPPPGFATYKLKLTGDLAVDLPRVAAARQAIGPAALRLDANGAWSATEALRALEAFAPYRPEYVEQPCALEDLPEVVRHAAVPVAADECVRPDTLDRVLAAGVRILVLKPAALGGLRATQALLARAPGIQAVLTSALDRGISTAGVLHLAATLPELPACGLATAGLFAGGPLLPIAVRQGLIAVPRGPGLWATEVPAC